MDSILSQIPAIKNREMVQGYNFIAGAGSDQGTFIIKLKPFEERQKGLWWKISGLWQGDGIYRFFINPYDATGVIGITTNSVGGRTLLTSANLNCLFLGKVGNGYLANTNNVVDGDACASLVLTDGNYSFGAPSDFTATSVSYNRAFTVDQPSTVCLPFALTAEQVTEAGTFYELTGYSDNTLTFSEVATTEAYKPYLFKAAKANPFTSYSGKAVGATPADLSVTAGGATMTGTMARQSVNGKYGWNSADGVFSKATSDAVTIDPFRAYITISGAGSARMS